jgi:NADP-dependent 3-hydroxy acid dehydrogenase YdfG
MENLNDLFWKSIKGKRIVVTGGTTGIGRATVELFASLGGRVLTFGRNEDDFEKAFDEIKSKYPECELYGIPGDVTDKEHTNKIFEMVDEDLGGIDILVNNAALASDGITKNSAEEWKYILETNILGYLAFTEKAVERMTKMKSGHIVNIGSMSAETREETGTVYVATKSAIRGFTAALRKEINPLGIKVSLIEPGAVTSDMQPAPKEEQREKIKKMEMLEAEDIALSILFCLSQPQRCDIVSMQVRPFLQII